MTTDDRKRDLIEEAAKAIYEAQVEESTYADLARAAFAVFEAAQKPTDDEREALKIAIGYEPVPLSIRDHPEIRSEYRTTADRDGLIERILAAGFRRPVSPAERENGSER